jgi:hypothetical protein
MYPSLTDCVSPVVINAASASHDSSAKALIEGLALRQKATGRGSYLIHVSFLLRVVQLLSTETDTV